MARIAFILLCHKDPDAIIAQANRLTAAGDYISIHFDARGGADAYARIKSELAANPNVTFARKRIKCGWGEWSLVQATLYAVEAAEETFPRATHFYMTSGDCMAIKTAEYMHAFLDAKDADYIESFDFFESGWIKTGIRKERLIYRHFFNEREQKRLFYASLEWQQRLGLERAIPEDLQIMIGSQWWCLRRRTIEAILEFTRKRQDVMAFFRRTWIPDETFFQTLVPHLVPDTEIERRTLTFLMFTDYGMPVVFHNDHYDLLLSQDYFFARKISPNALELKERLGALFAETGVSFQVSNEGRSLFEFLTNQGRHGRRFGQRFWEAESSLGRERDLYIITCKKWHVAKRLAGRIRTHLDIPTMEYLFNEIEAGLPDLGGIERDLTKRTVHRRSWMRMLFDYYDTNRLVICIDPADYDAIRDFYQDRSGTHLLEIDCDFSDDYLEGHAKRVGLAGELTPPEAFARLVPTIRGAIRHEADLLQEAGLHNHYRLSEQDDMPTRAKTVARFLDIPLETAQDITDITYLFED